MSVQVVDHTDGSRVFLDTEKAVYYRIPEIHMKTKFIRKGREIPFYNSFMEFLTTSDENAIIPVFCGAFKHIKRRTQAELITFKDVMRFFNVEMANSKWTRNDIEQCIKGVAYFAYVERNDAANNDLIIKQLTLLTKTV